MKLASTALKSFLATYESLGTPGNLLSPDLYTIVTGSGRVVLNQALTPISNFVTVPVPTDGLGITGAFMQDMGVREANGDCLQFATSGPGFGQYTVSGSTYHFFDSNPKLISYIYRVGQTYGLPDPTIVRLCSIDQNIKVWGQTFFSAGQVNNPGGVPQAAIQRSKIRLTVGMEVAQLEVTIYADPTNTVNNAPIVQQIGNGFFDGAVCYVQRLIMPTWLSSVGGILENGLYIMFSGSVADQKVGRASATLTVKSRTEMLNTPMPRNLYQTGCRFTLFDTGCTLDPAPYLATGTAQAGSNFSTIQTNLTQQVEIPAPTANPSVTDVAPGSSIRVNAPLIVWVRITLVSATGETTPGPEVSYTIPSGRLAKVFSPGAVTGVTAWRVYVGPSPGGEQLQATNPIGTDWTMPLSAALIQGVPPPTQNTGGWFDLGVVTFTSGALLGQSRIVASYAHDGISGNNTLAVIPAFPVSPGPGDTFNVLPGCDKQQTTCSGKFANLANFGGFPYIPTPETVI